MSIQIKKCSVICQWDSDYNVWWTESKDIGFQGLNVNEETIEELIRSIEDVISSFVEWELNKIQN